MKRQIERIFRYALSVIRRSAAFVLLILGTGLSYIFISVGFWSIIGPVVGVAVGSLIAVIGLIVVKLTGWKSITGNDQVAISWRIPIIFCCLYIIAILVGTRFYLYERPVWLYGLFAAFAGLIAYQIARGQSERLVIPQILTLAFFTYWSSQLLFPAGMYNPDTHNSYVPNINGIYESGIISRGGTIYAGHYAMATEFSMITGLDPQTGYYLVSTLLLVSTIMIISVLNRPLPAISSKMALYAAIIFTISSWMLRRGFHPNKLNFFYPLILSIGIVSLTLSQTKISLAKKHAAWAVAGLIITPAIVFGHQFSAGAALIFLFAIGGFVVVARVLPLQYRERLSPQTVLPFVFVFVLSVIGNPIHQGSLLGRLSSLLLSIFQSESQSSAGGAGRYSELSLDFLIVSTGAQTLLFALAVLGAIWLFRRQEWEYDFVIFWLGALSIFMVVSLLQNSADTQPQRFYAFLILFGFNICIGALFHLIDDYSIRCFDNFELRVGQVIVVVLIMALAVSSLASPVADEATSPVADSLPHNKKFTTNQEIAGNDWSDRFTLDQKSVVPLKTNVQIDKTSDTAGEINYTTLDVGTVILYSSLSAKTGVISQNSLSFGGRVFVFVDRPTRPEANRVYTNGESEALQV